MRNPFSYGGIVQGKTFCNRVVEQKDLVRAVENSEKLFIHSERRIGKTVQTHGFASPSRVELFSAHRSNRNPPEIVQKSVPIPLFFVFVAR